jgi:hypothetical protein
MAGCHERTQIHLIPWVRVAEHQWPAGGRDVDDWLAWVRTAEAIVRAWEADRGRILPTRDAARLVERIARALQQASTRPRRNR